VQVGVLPPTSSYRSNQNNRIASKWNFVTFKVTCSLHVLAQETPLWCDIN